MRLIAECDYCMDQIEISAYEADTFEKGICDYCGEGMCSFCKHISKPLHEKCAEELDSIIEEQE